MSPLAVRGASFSRSRIRFEVMNHGTEADFWGPKESEGGEKEDNLTELCHFAVSPPLKLRNLVALVDNLAGFHAAITTVFVKILPTGIFGYPLVTDSHIRCL